MNNLKPLNYLDDAMFDFTVLKFQLAAYSYEYQWNRFVRSE